VRDYSINGREIKWFYTVVKERFELNEVKQTFRKFEAHI
jgi:hypothetical protein